MSISLDPFVQVVHLAASVHLALDGSGGDTFVVQTHVGLDGMTVARRSLYDADIAHPRQRHLQRARDGRGAEGQHVGLHLHSSERLLLSHSEALLLIHDDQAQALGFHILRQQPVRADEHIHLSGREVLEDALLLGCGPETRDHLPLHREVGEPLTEGAVVLLRKDGGGDEHHHLFAVQRRLEAVARPSVLP